MKASHHWLQEYIVEELPGPEKLAELITFRAWEIDGQENLENGDVVYDLKILPDRAHDCLGHYGVARELVALLGFTLRSLIPLDVIPAQAGIQEVGGDTLDSRLRGNDGQGGESISVVIQSPLCRRYMARVIRGVKIGESSEWLKQKLESIGQRSINNVVDATNYVQFALGQPTHVFDVSKITGNKIQIIEIENKEPVTLLDSKSVELNQGVLAISDSEKILAVAGVKGGKAAEVGISTTDIVLEVANFDPVSVRKTARSLGIVTDASKRFENEPSPELCTYAMRLLTDTIVGVAGGVPESVIDQYPVKQIELVVECTVEYIASRLGMNVTGADIANTLQARGFAYVERDGVFSITVPWWRLDITGPHDIVEEVGKQMGYDKIIPKLPDIRVSKFEIRNSNPEYYWVQRIRRFLLERGFSEVMTYTFVNTGDVEVLASTSDKSFLRTNLSDGFTESLEKNYRNRDLLGLDEIRQFEIGKVFREDRELLSLAIGIKGNKKSQNPLVIWQDLFLSLGIESNQSLMSYIEKSIFTDQNIFEVHIGGFVENLPIHGMWESPEIGSKNSITAFRPWSSYPFISRDIAVWVPENIDPNTLVAIYKKHGGDLLVREPRLFDQFSKDGRTSYAYRLVFQSYEKTLTDVEIQPIINIITSEIVDNGWEVR